MNNVRPETLANLIEFGKNGCVLFCLADEIMNFNSKVKYLFVMNFLIHDYKLELNIKIRFNSFHQFQQSSLFSPGYHTIYKKKYSHHVLFCFNHSSNHISDHTRKLNLSMP